jgi:hypothetical protein
MDNFINPNANFFQQGQGGNPMSNVPLNTTPTTNNLAFPTATTLTSSQLSAPAVSSTPLTPATNPSAFVGSLPVQTPEQEGSELQQRIAQLTQQLGGQTQDVANLQAQAGLPDQAKQLADANLKLAQMQREFQLAEQQASQSGETLGFAQGRSQQVRQQAAIELGAQAARVQALQGNIETANQIITNTINQKYAPMQNQLNFLVKNLEMNMENMDRAERKRAQLQIENFKQQEINIERAKLAETISQRKSNEIAASGQYTPKQVTLISKLNADVSKNDTYQKTTNMLNFVNNVKTALSQETGVGDIAAINQFQKVIDEGAVTRDQDVQLIQSSQSLLNTLQTKITKLQKGQQLSPELRAEMNSAVDSLLTAQKAALLSDPFISAKTREIQFSNINPGDTILGDIQVFTTPSAVTPSSTVLTPGSTGTTSSGMSFKIIGGQPTAQPTAQPQPTQTAMPQFTAPQPTSMENVSNLFSGFRGFNIGNLFK